VLLAKYLESDRHAMVISLIVLISKGSTRMLWNDKQFCSTNGSCRVTNPVIRHACRRDGNVITTNTTFPLSFVTHTGILIT